MLFTPAAGVVTGTASYKPRPLPIAFMGGLNYPWNAFAADFGTGGFGTINNFPLVTTDFADFHTQKVNTVRWWVMGDGRYCPTFDGSGAVTGLNSGFLADLDTALGIAATNDLYLILNLIDNIMFNVASFSGSVQLGGHDDIIKNTTRRNLFFENALKPILQHVAASPHKDRVIAYDIINEPEAQIAGGYNGFDFFTGPAQFQLQDVQAFVSIAVDYIRKYGGGVLATVGSAIPVWCPLWNGLGLDFHQAHYYIFMDVGGPAGSGMTPVGSITDDFGRHLDAPCILGEFATADVSYGLSDTTPLSANWYLDTALARGYVGALGWSLHGGDSTSDWTSFAPVFTNWMGLHFP